MSTYTLSINSQGVEAGANRVEKSFKQIQAAAERMKTGTKGSIDAVTRAMRELAAMRAPNAAIATNLTAISKAIGSFKNVSKTSVDATLTLLKGLTSISGRVPAAGPIAALLGAVAGFKGPSQAAAKNTKALLNALSGVSGFPRVSGGFKEFVNSLANFRGPSRAAADNTKRFLQALANFQPPRGVGSALTAMRELAAEITRAARAMDRLNRSTAMPDVTGRARQGLQRLRREHGHLDTAIFRTQTAIHQLGGVMAGLAIVKMSIGLDRMRSQFMAATGSMQQGRIQMEFVRKEANRLGMDLLSVGHTYGLFLGSVKGMNITFAETQQIFKGFATAAVAMQLPMTDVEGVFRALGQIMSKGKLQAEELRGQLGDRLPGAFTRFAVALKMTKPGELDKALKDGAISGDKLNKALIQVAKTYEHEMAPAAEVASKNVLSSFNRLKNLFVEGADNLGKSGMNEALISLMDLIRRVISSDGFQLWLKTLGAAMKLAADNAEILGVILGSVFASKMILGISVVGRFAGVIGNLSKVWAGLKFAAYAASIGRLTQAFRFLTLAMSANPAIFLTTALAALISVVTLLKSKQDDLNDEWIRAGESSVYVANLVDWFTKRMDSNTSSVAANTAEIKKNIAAKLQQAATGGDAESMGIRIKYKKGGGRVYDSKGMGSYSIAGNYNRSGFAIETVGLNGPKITEGDMGTWLSVLDRTYDPNDKVQLKRHATALFQAETLVNTAKEGTYNKKIMDFISLKSGKFHTIMAGDLQGNSSPRKLMDQMFPGWNGAENQAVIKGDVPEKAEKNSAADKAAREAQQELEEYLNTLQEIRRAFRDLKAEVASNSKVVAEILGGKESVIAEANASAAKKVQEIEDSFKTPKRAAEGLQTIAKELGFTAANADEARKALTSYYSTLEETNTRLQVDNTVAKRIEDSRTDLKYRLALVDATYEGGAALEKITSQVELEIELTKGTVENRGELLDKMMQQIRAQRQLNNLIAYAKIMGEARDTAKIARDQTQYTWVPGNTSDDYEQQKKLIELRYQYEKEGRSTGEIQNLLDVEKALYRLVRAQKELGNEMERINQLSVDFADTMVDGLRNIVESTDSLGTTLKNVFKNMARIIQDFVIYEPLKEWLRSSFAAKIKPDQRKIDAVNDAANDVLSTADSAMIDANSALQEVQRALADKIVAQTEAVIDNTYALKNPVAPPAQVVTLDPASVAQAATNSPGNSFTLAGSPDFDPAELEKRLQTIVETGYQKTEDLYKPTQSTQDTGQDIVVTADTLRKVRGDASLGKQAQNPVFDRLKKMFDWKNGPIFGKGGIKESFGKIFEKGGSFGQKVGAIGTTIGKVAGAAMQAYATYDMVKNIGKKLGLGKVGSSALGGAAAGFQMGGPIGAAIGTVVGAALGFLKKSPSAYANVSVGADGRAVMSGSGKRGKGDRAAAEAAAQGGISLFESFANQFDASLSAGKYGTFGSYKKKNFYSTVGNSKKGKPLGREGVDYIYGTDSELQAFALKKQITSGKFSGLDPVYQTIARNTKSTTMETFQSDLETGKRYLDFIFSAVKETDVEKSLRELKKNFESLRKSASALGLDTLKLDKAYAKMLKTYRDDFNRGISQDLLSRTDPLKALWNDLLQSYEDTLANGKAVGGDLLMVEELYGKKRQELIEEYLNNLNNGLRGAMKDMLRELTGTPNAPLSAGTVLTNAGSNFDMLKSQFDSGNFSNSGNMQSIVSAYLDSAKGVYGSSSGFYDVYNKVTEFLGKYDQYATGGSNGQTSVEDLPALPSLEEMMKRIDDRNAEVVDTTKNVGNAIVEGNMTLEQILAALQNGTYGQNTNGADPGLMQNLVESSTLTGGGSSSSGTKYSGNGLGRLKNGLMLNQASAL